MIAYCNMVASWQNPKKKPPTIERYMRLDVDAEQSEEYVEQAMNRLYRLQSEYAEKVRLKNMVN